jgi:polyhydroxyalkanoate synthesis regulator phasin
MADEKAASGKGKTNPDKKQTAKKPGGGKKSAAKKSAAKKSATKKPSAKKSSAKSTAKKSSAEKTAPKSSSRKASSRSTVGLDKSLVQLRESLEHSVTLSRERIQEVVDDAVKRGRMTHGDAEKMIGELFKRGRKQTDALLSELEKLVRQARRKLP